MRANHTNAETPATESTVPDEPITPTTSTGLPPAAPVAGSRTGADRQRRRFEEQMLPHLDSLYRAAYSMTRNSGDADDLVQDTFLRAYQFFDRFKGGTNARAWLFRIMTNLYINEYRRRQREPERLSYDEMEDFYLYNRMAERTGEGSGSVGSGGVGLSPETEILRKVQVEAIREAVARLPEEYRMTVVLADLNELSYQEISEILEIPIGTVRSRLSRGRRLVQKALWAYSDENPR